MIRPHFATLVLAAALAFVTSPTMAYVPSSASRVGISIAPRVTDFRYSSSGSSSGTMTMKLGMPSAVRAFNKKFRSSASTQSSSQIVMSDTIAAAEPEGEEKKSFFEKVCDLGRNLSEYDSS